jgi:hypothetical protein
VEQVEFTFKKNSKEFAVVTNVFPGAPVLIRQNNDLKAATAQAATEPLRSLLLPDDNYA